MWNSRHAGALLRSRKYQQGEKIGDAAGSSPESSSAFAVSCPFLVGAILDTFEIANIGNGLGLGLLLFFGVVVAGLFFLIGALVERLT